jgi:hypothetical protein
MQIRKIGLTDRPPARETLSGYPRLLALNAAIGADLET